MNAVESIQAVARMQWKDSESIRKFMVEFWFTGLNYNNVIFLWYDVMLSLSLNEIREIIEPLKY